ncbi:SERTA domain-containing protein 3 [Marasmius crinis-equi]|uniref:SERTA domain-containing protein 3 n=1 Tax=Marasmius crinis-equi TaxID=585013 RepID=A0ABR3F3Q7_9AGAR
MAPPSKFKLARLHFLLENLDAFAEADANGMGQDFLSDLVKCFLRRFLVWLDGLEVEPTAEELEKVDDTEELDEVEEPVKKDGMSDEAFAKAQAEFEKYNSERNTLSGQIKNFMNYCNRNRIAPFTKAHCVLLDKLAGLGGPGRRKTAFNVWAESEEGKARCQEELDKLKKNGKQDVSIPSGSVPNNVGNVNNADVGGERKKADAVVQDGGKKMQAYVTQRQNIIKAEFSKLSKEEQAKWQAQVEAEYQGRKVAYESLVEDAYSKEPEARQRALEELPTWVLPLLEGIRAITGMNVSLFAGGPVPADNGNINIMGIHCGTTKDTPPKTFGVVHQSNLQKFFVPMFGDFCRKTFSQEECKAASLGSTRKGGAIFGLDTEVMLDRWGDKEQAEYWKSVQLANGSESVTVGSSSSAKNETQPKATKACDPSTSSGAAIASTVPKDNITTSSSVSSRPLTASIPSTAVARNSSASSSTSSRPASVPSATVAKDSRASTSSSSRPASLVSTTAVKKGSGGLSAYQQLAASITQKKAANADPGPRAPSAKTQQSSSLAPSSSCPPNTSSTTSTASRLAGGIPSSISTSASGPRALPVGGSSSARGKNRNSKLEGGLDYQSTIQVGKLKRRERNWAAMTTGGEPPKRKLPVNTETDEGPKKMQRYAGVGSTRDPIELMSSPVPRKRLNSLPPEFKVPDPEVIELSSSDGGSSPAPSPVKKKNSPRSPSPSSSPSTLYASPQPSCRPRHIAASSPPELSQPSAPPDSPCPPARSSMSTRLRVVSSASSTASAGPSKRVGQKRSEKLRVVSSPSSAVKTMEESKGKRKEVYIEITRPAKCARKDDPKTASVRVGAATGTADGGVDSWLRVPEGAPDYVSRAVRMAARVQVDEEERKWKSLVAAWLDLERALDFRGSGSRE